MTVLRVWAPDAEQVVLECGGTDTPMACGDGGWWTLEASPLAHGVDYGFRLDGDGPFPDPRSRWQPEGVHGPSRWVDHTRFEWSDAGWQAPPLSAAVIAEIHVGTLTPAGTFDAVIDRLDHLVALGITHVELMPVQEFPGTRGWGYDGVDLFAPHHAYGGPDGLKRLVDACHRRGLAVLLDVVYNHLGPDGNYLARFGPYFTDAYHTPWGDAVNLDRAHSDEVRRFFLDNARMWLRDYHFDGLRIDAIHAIVDTSATHFLEALSAEVRRLEAELGRHLVLIAESDLNDPRTVRPVAIGGHGLDAQWNEDFHHALHAALTGESGGYYADFGRLADLARVLTRGFAYDGAYSRYRRRNHGRAATGVPGRRFVGCLQNHDQVGNRAAGERSSHLLSPELLKVGAALVLTSPFVPMLFQGEEWGATTPFLYFTDHSDPELGAAVRDGRRKEFAAFGWDPEGIPDPQARETFERSRLDWDERSRAPHAELLEWHRRLIALRRGHPAFADDRLEPIRVHFDDGRRWLVMLRPGIVVACNLAGDAQRLDCPEAAGCGVLLGSNPGVAREGSTLVLPGESVAVLCD
ncbi:Malto-oligosyltrehalose trehalohydrolase [Thioalkalivibrio nitratireducens DSM 14787]|uniref:Malto-oligosyltrehalose trehalohydrolase n=1 Tax=Thioalkalivibrio nitratireducens (strain DSM 14787 / UNIQEM 213 / ALEN2) TaxID=1255043 RepID=L0DUV7_THIND|nr:malto-oligosyltrehalose trehalohydrolase [Thioalkalivibrio nitratireducens]AGA32792.1 Malto-oligosyltrehalose trehalohydrolase [Thioalkalivibrio nitratireducens DSM 14787]